MSPKILILDIETSYLLVKSWGIWEQNIPPSNIVKDWHVLAWAAKWAHEPASKIMYMDQSKAKDISNDKNILKPIWKLIDEADIIVTQNGKKFDIRKLNSRFKIHGMEPPSSFRHIDTKQVASRLFGFTSNSLEYLSEKLNKKYKKLKHKKFPGMDLWDECVAGNKEAWKEMKRYNIHDVLALEELYNGLVAWDNSLNFSIYHENNTCSCGSTEFIKKGFKFTNAGKYQRYKCVKCGSEAKDKTNLLTKARKKNLMAR